MTKKNLGVLMHEAKILERAAKVSGNFIDLNNAIIEILNDHLNKVQLRILSKRTHAWEDRYADLMVEANSITLKIPVFKLQELDWELAEKVENKMKTPTIVNGQLRSFLDTDLPMNWEEFDKIELCERAALQNALLKIMGIDKNRPDFTHGDEFLLLAMSRHSIPMSEVNFEQGKRDLNYAVLSRTMIQQHKCPDSIASKNLVRVFNTVLERFITQRRAKRIAVEVKIPVGETKWGRYSYGIAVRAEGNTLSVTNTGATSHPKWEWLADYGWCRGIAKNREFLNVDFMPYVNNRVINKHGFVGDQKWVDVDVVSLPDENGYWRWMLYLPKKHWEVTGGSVAYHDRAITYRAKITRD
jgi:hypothetical protein